jgi:MFS family permease
MPPILRDDTCWSVHSHFLLWARMILASNFPPEERPRAYGLVASAGAIAVAAGPLIGGAVTTYLTWRLVFAGEEVIVLIIPC